MLVSDGEDTCTPPSPCEVARDLRKQGVDLRVEAIGFQVGSAARDQLACVAKATGGSYYDAPDSRALTGQLQALSLRAFRSYEPLGVPITGTPDAAGAPEMTPGAWVDELAPGETRTYAIDVTDGAVPVVNGALIAGATQPRLAGPENFLVRITDEQGNECARGSSSQSSETFTAAATATGARAVEGSGAPCTEPGPRLLQVQRQFDGGEGVNTVEILFSEIGEPDESADPAPAIEPGPAGGAAARPGAGPGRHVVQRRTGHRRRRVEGHHQVQRDHLLPGPRRVGAEPVGHGPVLAAHRRRGHGRADAAAGRGARRPARRPGQPAGRPAHRQRRRARSRSRRRRSRDRRRPATR